MKNTTKLKHILQLYTISLDIDDICFHLLAINKRTNSEDIFTDKSYTEIIDKVFRHMMKELKISAVIYEKEKGIYKTLKKRDMIKQRKKYRRYEK